MKKPVLLICRQIEIPKDRCFHGKVHITYTNIYCLYVCFKQSDFVLGASFLVHSGGVAYEKNNCWW